MEIKQLRYFVVCADAGSFKKAAEDLYTAQSHISKVIQSLENELGTRLFIRKYNGVELTPAGRLLYSQSQKIIQLVQETDTLMHMQGTQAHS